MTKDIGRDVCAQLVRMGVAASWEYPGWICVPVEGDKERSWAIGDMNATWQGQLQSEDGQSDGTGFDTQIQSGSDDVTGIAEAIAEHLRHSEALVLLRDALVIVEESEQADQHGAWLVKVRALLGKGAA